LRKIVVKKERRGRLIEEDSGKERKKRKVD
jgi:hypothetical protein